MASPTVHRRRRRRRWWSPKWLWRHHWNGRRRRSPPKWKVAVGLAVAFACLAGMGAAAAFFQVRPLRTALISLRSTISQVSNDPEILRSAESRASSQARIKRGVQELRVAQQRTFGSAPLRVARVVPVLRSQPSGLSDLVDDSITGAVAAHDLLGHVNTLIAQSRLVDGAVPLDALSEVGIKVKSTSATLARMVRPSSGLIGPLGDARREVNAGASRVSRRLADASDVIETARTFLGADGPRRYLVAVQNNAEMRDQGTVLSYVVARFEGGQVRFEENGSTSTELALDRPTPTPIPPGTQEIFGFTEPTRYWPSVNGTADFAWSARAMRDMYHQSTGQPLDGIVAIDVPALAGLLGTVGPVQVEDISEPISQANAARILLHDLYEGLPPHLGAGDQDPRREKLADVTRAVISRLTTGERDLVGIGQRLAEAAAGGHFRLWSSSDREEEVFERTGLGGGPAAIAADRTFHFALQNRTATKLDYFVKPKVRQNVELLENGDARVRTTVSVVNDAPVGAAPSYQLGPDQYMPGPGHYLGWLLLWGPAGSRQAGGTVESGLVLSQYVVGVEPGGRRELSFDTIIPEATRNGRLTLRLVPQPRLEPIELEVRVSSKTWSIDGPTTWTGPWDRVRSLSWTVRR